MLHLGFGLSLIMHVVCTCILIFVLPFSQSWKDDLESSIPVSITKLSDLTRGPKLGPRGIIDPKVPLANKVEETKMIAANPKPNTIDTPLKTITQAPSQDVKKTNTTKEESNLIDEKALKTDNKIKDKKPETKNNEKKVKNAMDELANNIMQKDKQKKTNAAVQKGVESFVNSIIGSEDGKGAEKSGGAQEVGELSVAALTAFIEMIKPCWKIVTMPRADEIQVRIEIELSPDGFVEKATVLNPQWSDPVYKNIANSATRALADKRCQPFKLPIKEYAKWSKMIVNFCPSAF